MHRGITILAVCLLILLTFPRIASEQAKEDKDSTKNGGNATRSEKNVSIAIAEIKPMASELISNVISENVTNTSVLNQETLDLEQNDLKGKETKVIGLRVPTPGTANTTGSITENGTIENLKEEIKRAKEDLFTKQRRLEEIKKKADTAQELSLKAQDHLKSLIFVLNSLQGSLIQSSKAAFETDWQLQLQTGMYNEAKRKYARLSRELEMTKKDYEKTKNAAESAMFSAKIAQKNSADTARMISNFTGQVPIML